MKDVWGNRILKNNSRTFFKETTRWLKKSAETEESSIYTFCLKVYSNSLEEANKGSSFAQHLFLLETLENWFFVCCGFPPLPQDTFIDKVINRLIDSSGIFFFQ